MSIEERTLAGGRKRYVVRVYVESRDGRGRRKNPAVQAGRRD